MLQSTGSQLQLQPNYLHGSHVMVVRVARYGVVPSRDAC